MDPDDMGDASMRLPLDLNQKIKTLATMDGKTITEWNDSVLREWLEKVYSRRMKREATAAELGGEG